MTRYTNDARIPSKVPTASPINKNPIWLIDEYAMNLLVLFSTNADKQPQIIDVIEEAQIIKDHKKYISLKTNPNNFIKNPNTPILIGKIKSAVIL